MRLREDASRNWAQAGCAWPDDLRELHYVQPGYMDYEQLVVSWKVV